MENKRAKKWLSPAVYILAALLFAGLVIAYLTGNMGVNPIQKFHHLSGDIALISLLLSLSITPLRTLTGNTSVGPLRRTFGLIAFYYAVLHFLIFVGLDYRFSIPDLVETIGFRPYIWAGIGAFLILTVLAITSIKKVKIAVKKAWKKIHSFVYLAGILVVLHYAWSVKGNLFLLSGAVGLPLLAAVVLAILLILRLPPVKKLVLKLR